MPRKPKSTKLVGYDQRPRFGWTDDLDKDPQHVWEAKSPTEGHPVVVIPLPFLSPKMKSRMRQIAKSLWPE